MQEGETTTVSSKPLLGTDEATIDDKGRILVTKKKRDRLGENFTIAVGACGCLVAYPEARWNAVVDEILSSDAINIGREQYTRMIHGSADDECNFDAQGRVGVPKKLREVANLKGEVLLIGCGDRVEIWAKNEYEMYQRFPLEYGKDRRAAIENSYKQMKGL